jgi:hypothetical protein
MYSKFYKNEKEITTKQVAGHLFDLAEKIYAKSKGNVTKMPALQSAPKKTSFNYYTDRMEQPRCNKKTTKPNCSFLL